MVEKAPVDTSKLILSPMPGKLVSMLVEDGQTVRLEHRSLVLLAVYLT